MYCLAEYATYVKKLVYRDSGRLARIPSFNEI